MILDVFMRRTGKYNNNFLFEVKNDDNIYFVAFKDYSPAKLLIDGNEYSFPLKIKKIKRKHFTYKYPINTKKDIKLGFQILKNDEVVAEYYRDAATIGKKWIFKRNLAFDVFAFEGRTHMVFQVGPKNNSSHYYCIKDANTKETVAIIKRLAANKKNARAQIYFKDDRYLLLSAMVMTTIMVVNICDDGEGNIIDLSAPNYISIKKEELAELDMSFIDYIERHEERRD